MGYKTYGRQKSASTRFRNNFKQAVQQDRNQQDVQRKKSGAKLGMKDGRPYVHGWNVSKSRGYMTFIAFPYKDTHETRSENGKTWQNWMLKITMHATLTEVLKPCLFEVETGRVLCKDLNLIANPKAPNGGYFGRMIGD